MESLRIVGILGRKRNGKDTIADYLVSEYGYEKVSFSDPLKEACSSIFGFTDEQLYGNEKEDVDQFWGISPREILQKVGTDLFRNNFGFDIWVKCLSRRISQSPNKKFVVADIRFQNEADMIANLGGFLIKVERPCMIGKENDHVSETAVDSITNYSVLIKNDSSLDNLYNKIKSIFNTYAAQVILASRLNY